MAAAFRIAALAVGMAQGAYESALRYAKERETFGRPIAEFEAISIQAGRYGKPRLMLRGC